MIRGTGTEKSPATEFESGEHVFVREPDDWYHRPAAAYIPDDVEKRPLKGWMYIVGPKMDVRYWIVKDEWTGETHVVHRAYIYKYELGTKCRP